MNGFYPSPWTYQLYKKLAKCILICFSVYAILIEYMSRLSPEALNKMDRFMYDDMCHMKPFSEKESIMNKNEITRKFGEANKAVDKFHFPGHVSKKCHETCDPYKMECFNDINSPICEQVFSRLNKFTQVKGMNESHFLFFFIYILDLQNLSIEKRLREVANPLSAERTRIVAEAYKSKDTPVTEVIENLSLSLASLNVNQQTEKVSQNQESSKLYNCNMCTAKYKMQGFLKKHTEQKHGEKMSLLECDLCKSKFDSKKQQTRHMKIHEEKPGGSVDALNCGKCDKKYKLEKYFDKHVSKCNL